MVFEQKPLAGPCQDTSYICVKNKNISEDISAAPFGRGRFHTWFRKITEQAKQATAVIRCGKSQSLELLPYIT